MFRPRYAIILSWPPDFDMWEVLMSSRSVNLFDLEGQAKTLRQRCFFRLIKTYTDPRKVVFKSPENPFGLSFDVAPLSSGLRGLMAACYRAPECRKMLSNLTFYGRRISDPEIRKSLQDLADIVAWEASEAFVARYYPGIEDIEPLSPDHVREVMRGMQREMDREGGTSPHGFREAAIFEELPWERQVALAERRRYWFAQFGITPERWKTSTFSLWEVDNKLVFPPEGYYSHWGTTIRPGFLGWVEGF